MAFESILGGRGNLGITQGGWSCRKGMWIFFLPIMQNWRIQRATTTCNCFFVCTKWSEEELKRDGCLESLQQWHNRFSFRNIQIIRPPSHQIQVYPPNNWCKSCRPLCLQFELNDFTRCLLQFYTYQLIGFSYMSIDTRSSPFRKTIRGKELVPRSC